MNTPVPAAAPMAVELLAFAPMIKGSLRGFAKVKLRGGLIIHDVPVLVSNDKAWASLPSKPLIGRDGTVLKSEDGKVRYVPVLEWGDKTDRNRWSDGVVAAVEAVHGPVAAMVAGVGMGA